jgi:alkaline phosphatase
MSTRLFSLKNRLIKPFVLVFVLSVLAENLQSQNLDKRLVLELSRKTTGRVDRPVRPVKNVILMIPDGCSLATVSLARWYQWLLHPDRPSLYIDPFISGTVRTSSSNAPIGDSAPTTSCYMTGELSRTGHVATYPLADGANDIFSVDTSRAYQPMMTVLEAAKLVHGKSTGLVFTCEFPHATPADCSSHDYNRNNYSNISAQMAYNRLDFVAGGGISYLKPDLQQYLTSNGYTVQLNDASGLRSFNGNKLWSLFGAEEMDYDLDRDSTQQPSLAEMTDKAIQTLSKNEKGFFLMVEGSKVDWAAHANDPIGMITDFLSFDQACKVALDFARKDGNTTVIIIPDHGNSGISIGTGRMGGYDKLTKNQVFTGLFNFKKTAFWISEELKKVPFAQAGDTIFKYTSIRPTSEELTWIDNASDYPLSSRPVSERRSSQNLHYTVARIMNLHTGIGYTTNGHTGEEVFMACYNPNGDVLNGVRFNFEVNDYLCSLLNLEGKLPELTNQHFAKHQSVFGDCTCRILNVKGETTKQLEVRKNKKLLLLTQNSSVALLNGKPLQLSSVVVFVDKNNTFYVDESLGKVL